MIHCGKSSIPDVFWCFFLSVLSIYKEGIPDSLQTGLIPYRIYFSYFVAVFSPLLKLEVLLLLSFHVSFDQHSPRMWEVVHVFGLNKCMEIKLMNPILSFQLLYSPNTEEILVLKSVFLKRFLGIFIWLSDGIWLWGNLDLISYY